MFNTFPVQATSPSETLLSAKAKQRPNAQDHRKPSQRTDVCDNRKPSQRPDVRDHRKPSQRPDVRDHRKPTNTKKPSPPPRIIPQDKRDNDKDGIADNLEMALANKFAPILRLPPSNKDWTRPANVDWYLQRAQLRYENKGACFRDDKIFKVGQVNQVNLARQFHRDKSLSWGKCKNKGTKRYSKSSTRFFLQLADKYHKGAPASEWKAYVHVKKSTAIKNGYDIQYWFFYAYNDSVAMFNHEGDWEHITVTVNSNQQFIEAIYAQHDYSTRYTRKQLTFVGKTQPVVYVSDGSHASYPRAGKFRIRKTPVSDHTYDGGPVWNTKKNLVNVGEKNYPLNQQYFIQYGGLWGEIGETKYTSGPTGPAFKAEWNGR
ncbi:MAG: Vps62-related protein [Proteobacteria bacterium]|nr:Vps62-related protein [Pseudomonadota bacterium]